MFPAPTKISPFDTTGIAPIPPYRVVIAVAAHAPEVITLLLKTTPDKEEALPVAVYKLPPIPTPPETIKAPEVVDTEEVEAEIVVVPPAPTLNLDTPFSWKCKKSAVFAVAALIPNHVPLGDPLKKPEVDPSQAVPKPT